MGAPHTIAVDRDAPLANFARIDYSRRLIDQLPRQQVDAMRMTISGPVNAQALIDAARQADGDAWHLVAVHLEGAIRALADRVNVAEGHHLRAARGCQIAVMTLGAASVPVEFQHTPAGGDGWNEPSYPATYTILRAYLSGRWCDAEDVIPGPVLERWTVELYEGGAL